MIDLNPSKSYQIADFCRDLLKLRFSGDPIKQKPYVEEDKINIACPYCGDSKKDPNKKRGHLYLKTQTYKCYNDGCSVHVTLKEFVSNFAQKYSLHVPTLGQKAPSFDHLTSQSKKGFLIEFMISQGVGTKLLSLADVASRFSLTPCERAPAGSPVQLFVESRKLSDLPTFKRCCYFDSRQDKIYLFNLDLKSNKILGFALRKLDDSAPGPKYNIKGYSELRKNGLARGMEDSWVTQVDSINNYFNLLNIDFSKPVIITEGQFDSMFLANCLATTGVTKSKALLKQLISKDSSLFLFDDDLAGRNQSIQLLKSGYRVFLWRKLKGDLLAKHPKYKLHIKKVKDVNDLYVLLSTIEPNTTGASFNSLVLNYFSESFLDLLSV